MGSPPHVKKPSKFSRVKRRIRFRLFPLLPALVLLVIVMSIALPAYRLYAKVWQLGTSHAQEGEYSRKVHVHDDPDQLPLYRDLYAQEPWPDVEWNHTAPSQTQHTIHYLWCGQKPFRFADYLGVLSAVRVAQPMTLIFHYTHSPPVLDRFWYHTWFQELKQSLAGLEMRRLLSDHECGSVGMLRDGLRLLAPQGGVLLGERVLLSKNVDHLRFLSFWFAMADVKEDPTRGVIFANTGFNDNTLEDYVTTILANRAACLTVGDYDRLEALQENSWPCVSIGAKPGQEEDEDLHPADIRSSDAPFAELARWLFYGRRRPFVTPHSGEDRLVPRVAHFVWLTGSGGGDGGGDGGSGGGGEVRFSSSSSSYSSAALSFSFVHFLSILSALHVAKLSQVYVHGEVEPRGPWWNELRSQNVTFVYIQAPNTVFEQAVDVPAHASDIARYIILYKYGGVYQDFDVIWVNHLPDWLLGYPAVASPEWPRYGQWPDTLNLGLFLAKPHAPFFRHVLSTYRYFRDADWNFNAVLMPYRTYEWYPDTLFLDQFLQAICSQGVCHPVWQDDYIDDDDNDDDNNDDDKEQVSQHTAPHPFSLREVRAVHFRSPKVPQSLSGPAMMRAGSDIFADIGKHVLRQAGREDLLGEGEE